MTDDPFDPERLRREFDEYRIREEAGRDRVIAVYRAVWEFIPAADRDEFKRALVAMDDAERRVERLSGGLLLCEPIKPNTEQAKELVHHDGIRTPATIATATAPKSSPIRAAELICAISCWENGEDYIPSHETHQRWPNAGERDSMRKLDEMYDAAQPAPDEPPPEDD